MEGQKHGAAGIPFPGKIGKEKLHFLPILMGNGKTLIIYFPLFPSHLIFFPFPSHPTDTYYFLPTSFLKNQTAVLEESYNLPRKN